MENTNKNTTRVHKPLSKIRIFFGLLFIIISVSFFIAFFSYLFSWKTNQSQAGHLIDRRIKSTNLLGKLGDWLGNFFIFDSIGVSAFIIAFLGKQNEPKIGPNKTVLTGVQEGVGHPTVHERQEPLMGVG